MPETWQECFYTTLFKFGAFFYPHPSPSAQTSYLEAPLSVVGHADVRPLLDAVLGVERALRVVGHHVAAANWDVQLGAAHGAYIARIAHGQGALK